MLKGQLPTKQMINGRILRMSGLGVNRFSNALNYIHAPVHANTADFLLSGHGLKQATS